MRLLNVSPRVDKHRPKLRLEDLMAAVTNEQDKESTGERMEELKIEKVDAVTTIRK